jgi:hypothetical protein
MFSRDSTHENRARLVHPTIAAVDWVSCARCNGGGSLSQPLRRALVSKPARSLYDTFTVKIHTANGTGPGGGSRSDAATRVQCLAAGRARGPGLALRIGSGRAGEPGPDLRLVGTAVRPQLKRSLQRCRDGGHGRVLHASHERPGRAAAVANRLGAGRPSGDSRRRQGGAQRAGISSELQHRRRGGFLAVAQSGALPLRRHALVGTEGRVTPGWDRRASMSPRRRF